MIHAEEKLKFELSEAIQRWVDDQSQFEEWAEIKILFPSGSVHQMTEAAFAVFATIYEAQQFAINEGYVKLSK